MTTETLDRWRSLLADACAHCDNDAEFLDACAAREQLDNEMAEAQLSLLRAEVRP